MCLFNLEQRLVHILNYIFQLNSWKWNYWFKVYEWLLQHLKCIVKLPSRKVTPFISLNTCYHSMLSLKNLFQFDRQNNVLLFLCTNFPPIGFPRGPTDIYVDPSYYLPDFFLNISEFHGAVEDWVSHQLCAQFCFNPPVNPNLSYGVRGISSPMFMVF